MAHTGKVGAHHALMGITMVIFGIGASTFGPKLMTNAATDSANAKQRDALVVLCKDKYVEKLTSAISAATSQPGVRRALEGYWKEVNQCVVRETKNVRTGSGTDMKKDRKEEQGKKGFSKVSPINSVVVKYGPTNFYWMGSSDPRYFQYFVELYDGERVLHKGVVTKGENGKFMLSIDLSTVAGIEKGKKYSWQVFANDGNSQDIADKGQKAYFLVGDSSTATGTMLKPRSAAPSEEFKPKEEFKFRNSATPKPGETPKPKPTHNGTDQI